MDTTNADYQVDLRDFQRNHGLEDAEAARILVISGLFVVNAQQVPTALNFTKRTVERLGEVSVADRAIVMPVDTNGGSKGYAFVLMESVEQAASVAQEVDGFQADRQHTFSASIANN